MIRQAHLDYFAAGAQVATTASYQASIPAFLRRNLTAREAEELILLSVRLATEARDAHGEGAVAASVGPYGAYLANGAEYTGDYDLDEDGLADWHRDRWHVLAASGADFLACETIPSSPRPARSSACSARRRAYGPGSASPAATASASATAPRSGRPPRCSPTTRGCSRSASTAPRRATSPA
nr:hypothetical protein GCM10020093_112920 [Planobispora longispora]